MDKLGFSQTDSVWNLELPKIEITTEFEHSQWLLFPEISKGCVPGTLKSTKQTDVAQQEHSETPEEVIEKIH